MFKTNNAINLQFQSLSSALSLSISKFESFSHIVAIKTICIRASGLRGGANSIKIDKGADYFVTLLLTIYILYTLFHIVIITDRFKALT